MRRTLPAVAIVCLTLAAPVSAAEYWPIGPGLFYIYQDEQGRTATIRYGGGGGLRIVDYGDNWWREETTFRENSDGDVVMDGTFFVCKECIDPSVYWSYRPPALFLDLPLTVGNVWTVAGGNGYGPPCSLPVQYEIVGEEQVTVPAGTFDTFVLRETSGSGERTYYLDRALGPVRITQLCQGEVGFWSELGGTLDLVRVDGATPTRPKTWGTVKVVYR